VGVATTTVYDIGWYVMARYMCMNKQEQFEELIAQQWVKLVLDSTQCVLPKHIKPGIIVLDVGYDMSTPIPDLEWDELGLSATLHFPSCGAFRVAILWSAVLAVEPYGGRPRATLRLVRGGKA
jgi:hypothetical protein